MSFQMKLNLWLTIGNLRQHDTALPFCLAGQNNKKARCRHRAFCFFNWNSALGRLFLDDGLVFRLGLGTATRPLGERSLDFLDRLSLGNALHGGYFARQPI